MYSPAYTFFTSCCVIVEAPTTVSRFTRSVQAALTMPFTSMPGCS